MYVQRCGQQWFKDNDFRVEQNTVKSVDAEIAYPDEAAMMMVFNLPLTGSDYKVELQCRHKGLGHLISQVLECIIGEPYKTKLSDIKDRPCRLIYNQNNTPIGIGHIEHDTFFVWGNSDTQFTEE